MSNLIVAYDRNKIIGDGLNLPWKQREDLKRVKELTSNKSIVMGYNTYLSLLKPLPNRKNYVITNKNEPLINDFIAISETEAKELLKDKNTFLFGGASTYKKHLNSVNFMYITEIDTETVGTNLIKFPNVNMSEWDLIEVTPWLPADEHNEYPYRFLVYSRKYDLFNGEIF